MVLAFGFQARDGEGLVDAGGEVGEAFAGEDLYGGLFGGGDCGRCGLIQGFGGFGVGRIVGVSLALLPLCRVSIVKSGRESLPCLLEV